MTVNPDRSGDAAELERVRALLQSAEAVLCQIRDFGFNNPGRGYSCALMAEIWLVRKSKEDTTWPNTAV